MSAQLRIQIDGRELDLSTTDESPIQISYNLEDEADSQLKSSAMAFDVEFPATLSNDRTFNTFRNPNVLDMSADGYYRKAQPVIVRVDDATVMAGKALLQSGSKGPNPEKYVVNFYGDNGDWITEMQDLTLYDCLPTNTHLFALYGAGGVGNPQPPYGIEDSWFFDGTNEDQTWVYAPVRYTEAFSDNGYNLALTQIRPSLFAYWVISRAFKQFGYSIQSTFMDTAHFRRLVMPWTWGNFLGINSKLSDLLRFKATGNPQPADKAKQFHLNAAAYSAGSGGGGVIHPGVGDLDFGDNFSLDTHSEPTGFDNFGSYSYDNATGDWKWTYKETGGNFGKITGYFGVTVYGSVTAGYGSSADFHLEVYKNGVLDQNILMYTVATDSTSSDDDGSILDPRAFNFQVAGINVGDVVSIRFRYGFFKSSLGSFDLSLIAWNDGGPSPGPGQPAPPDRFTSFQLFRIAIEPGATVNWKNFEQFKNFKFLDFLRGLLDCFDIIPTTDPVSKAVRMEPAHPYTWGGASQQGYFKTDRLDWTSKQDTDLPAEVVSFNDRERDYVFQFKTDNRDGGMNILGKRFSIDVTAGKYRFSSRFKEGEQTFENRFFSPVAHLKMTQWGSLPTSNDITPQIVAIVAENISNTSAAESEVDFAPRLCFYEGYLMNDTAKRGVFIFNSYTYAGYPYMFAVDYLPGGENKPILTYNDQRIGTVVAPGMLRRFFLPRLAIQDNGVMYKPWMMLSSNDVRNWAHRERIIIGNGLYLLMNIDRWDPISRLSVQCTMWKWIPVEQKHSNQVYPSSGSVLGTLTPVPTPDILYQQSFILTTDLPTF